MSEAFEKAKSDYSFLCKKCRERTFILLEDGTVECDGCKTRFTFISLSGTWEKFVSEKKKKRMEG